MNSELLLAVSLRKGLLKSVEKSSRSKQEVRFVCVYKVAFVQSSEKLLKGTKG